MKQCRRWMPRRKHTNIAKRPAISAAELEARITEIVRDVARCSKFKGICITHVESFGIEPNWFAQPLPQKIPVVCLQAFIIALGQVRREFDLLVEP
jgi:hypothetical protein